jgi:hypothetical protein
MTQRTYARRTQSQWHAIINDFSTSDLSGAAFCKQHQIQYASFCKWRQKLLPSTNSVLPNQPSSNAFIDLASLTDAKDPHDSTWHITLKLGNGVELVLSQS